MAGAAAAEGVDGQTDVLVEGEWRRTASCPRTVASRSRSFRCGRSMIIGCEWRSESKQIIAGSVSCESMHEVVSIVQTKRFVFMFGNGPDIATSEMDDTKVSRVQSCETISNFLLTNWGENVQNCLL